MLRSCDTLATESLGSRRSISMDSYDRLFPNQDTMPTGGFGILIALPLQQARRAEGCTVFLGETPQPHADQWGYTNWSIGVRPPGSWLLRGALLRLVVVGPGERCCPELVRSVRNT